MRNRTQCPSEDLDLLRQAAGGREEAFLRLFQRWSPALRRFLVRATGSRESGEDLLQEAWIRILRAAPRYEPTGTVAAWMFRIAANLAYGYWRHELRIRERLPSLAAVASEPERAQGESPERSRWGNAFAEAVDGAVTRLPPNHRMVFLLKVGQGLTYAEIAQTLKCPEGTVKSRLHHALLSLRAELAVWQEDGMPGTPALLPGARNLAVGPSPGGGES